MFIAQVLVGPSKQLEQIIQTERGRGFETRGYRETNPGPPDCHGVRHADHSPTQFRLTLSLKETSTLKASGRLIVGNNVYISNFD